MIYNGERIIPSPAILLATVKTYPVAQKNLVVLDPEENALYGDNEKITQITVLRYLLSNRFFAANAQH